jgi:hypothetical protein
MRFLGRVGHLRRAVETRGRHLPPILSLILGPVSLSTNDGGRSGRRNLEPTTGECEAAEPSVAAADAACALAIIRDAPADRHKPHLLAPD